MQIAFLDETLKYDGSQLSSHFAYQKCGLLGDSCVAFLGPCEVSLGAMVDLEDVRRRSPIFSPLMLHFIFENFSFELRSAVLFQRVMVVQVMEELQGRGVQELRRSGDDLYLRDRKLSVSIATASPVSTLIHLGINIRSDGAPVPAIGLEELNIDALDLAKSLLKSFQEEFQSILKATFKVKGVR